MKNDTGDFLNSLKQQSGKERFTVEEALDPDVTMQIMQDAVDKAIAQNEALGLVKEESLHLVYPEDYPKPTGYPKPEYDPMVVAEPPGEYVVGGPANESGSPASETE